MPRNSTATASRTTTTSRRRSAQRPSSQARKPAGSYPKKGRVPANAITVKLPIAQKAGFSAEAFELPRQPDTAKYYKWAIPWAARERGDGLAPQLVAADFYSAQEGLKKQPVKVFLVVVTPDA